MRILVDTHILLWCVADDPRLSARARDLVLDPANELAVSVVSFWEIAIKVTRGRLEIDLVELEHAARELGMDVRPVVAAHVRELVAMRTLHRDPFDRMLLAQARCDGYRLLSADSLLIPLGDPVLEA